jgi:hypothetical protein
MQTVLIHIMNEDPVLGEVEAMPASTDTLVVVKNPRRKDGKDISYLDSNVMTVVFPLGRVLFIELLSSKEEEIIGFVRE